MRGRIEQGVDTTQTTVAVVPQTLLAAAGAVLAGTMCGNPDYLANHDRICGQHDMSWPEGRSLCTRWDDNYTALWNLARAAVFEQVPVGGDFDEHLAAITARHAATTGGPWFWHGSTDTHEVSLAGRRPGHGITQVITTVPVERDPGSPEAAAYRRYLISDCGYNDKQADDAIYEWVHDHDGSIRHDHRLALMDPDRVLLETVEETAVFTVARQQGLPDGTPANHPEVYRRDICDVTNPNGRFLAASWADVAWLLGQVQQLSAAVERVKALLPDHGEPQCDEDGNFTGLTTGAVAAHRTLGDRAWSDAGTYCSAADPCALCLPPVDVGELRDALEGVRR